MGPQTHNAEDLSKNLLCQWKKPCGHLELHQLQLCTTEAACSLLFRVSTAQTSLDCCQKVRDLAMKYFPSTMAEICWATSPNHACGKATRSENPIQLTRYLMSSFCSALISVEWINQPLLLHKLPGDYACSWIHLFFTSHSPAKDGSLVEKKTKSNTPPFNETQRFQCAHTQWGQSKLVWVQDWCWPYTQWVGKLGTLLLFKDLGQVSWMLLLGDNAVSLNSSIGAEVTLMCK